MTDAYAIARERYAALRVDTEGALEVLAGIPLSVHCWQGDDVRGFERRGDLADGGLAVTGSHPGRARNADELRADLELALSLAPGRHRVNLHAIYAETGGRPVERDELGPEHFAGWIDWARERGLGLDMNPTFFAHPLAAAGATLSHPDEGVRAFWVRHGAACRSIGEAMGAATGSTAVVNVWVPDGSKDLPADRRGPRERLARSLDEMFSAPLDPARAIDSVESKLFGIGSEAYVAGSYDFYLAYAVSRDVALCLDTGHFHPTEEVADKVSAILPALPSLLLHVSRGLRWDSDHVVTLTDPLRALAEEVVVGGWLDRVRFALDYFDASVNRVAAWIIGCRSLGKALLAALLLPAERLGELERSGDLTGRLALREEAATLPAGAVFEEHCRRMGVPPGPEWLEAVRRHERDVLRGRG